MKTLIVTDQQQEWFEVPGAKVQAARRYLAQPEGDDKVRVLNLCRTGRYQGRGYYVSLLAEARGQRALPEVKTLGDLQSDAFVQALARELEAEVREAIRHDESDRLELDVYLGKDPARRYPELAQRLFESVRAPLLRVLFARTEGAWRLQAVSAIGVADIPNQDRAFLLETIKAHVGQDAAPRPAGGTRAGKPRLAILYDPDEPHQPSNDEAREKFVKLAPLVGLEAEVIELDALERVPEFDGLFNRASPDVDGISYQFMRRAEALGMPVVDDPESILRCTNKVYMHELMSRHGIEQPRSLVVHRGNVGEIIPAFGLPCVLKLPDSGFGLDVVKIESEEELRQTCERFFKVSELFIAQEWLPTGFDWRVGVYDRRPLFVSKYFMAPGHWKINQVTEGQKLIEGDHETISVGEAPEKVIDLAVRAANLVGRSLYGVDLKQVGDRVLLVEVNCNPNIDAGVEDQALGDALYREVLGVFARRIAERRDGARRPASI